jgi:hypothetical protein
MKLCDAIDTLTAEGRGAIFARYQRHYGWPLLVHDNGRVWGLTFRQHGAETRFNGLTGTVQFSIDAVTADYRFDPAWERPEYGTAVAVETGVCGDECSCEACRACD